MKSHTLGLLAAVGVGAVLAASGSCFVVDQTEQALVLELGKPVRVISTPGLNFKMPLVQNVEFFDKRLLDFNDSYNPIEVIAADQKRLIVDSFVRYRITDPLKFKQAVGDERTMRSRLNAILEASLRQVIGSVPLSDVISGKREELMRKTRDLVNAQAQGAHLDENGNVVPNEANQGFGIKVVDVRIERADLPSTNSESIYRRMQTEREREAKEFRAKGAEDAQKIISTAEKERTILLAEAKRKAETIRGEGDSAAIKIFASAVNQDPDFYQFYRTMQAYRKTLSKEDTTLVLSPDNEFLKYIEKGGDGVR